MQSAPVINLAKRGDDRREVDRAVAKEKMVVDPTNHVLDMDIHDSSLPGQDVVLRRLLLDAVQVPDIEREVEQGVLNSLIKFGEIAPWYQ